MSRLTYSLQPTGDSVRPDVSQLAGAYATSVELRDMRSPLQPRRPTIGESGAEGETTPPEPETAMRVPTADPGGYERRFDSRRLRDALRETFGADYDLPRYGHRPGSGY